VRGRVSRIPISGIQTSRSRGGSLLTSRVAKSRRDRSHPSEEDRWQRSRDLTNSEVRRVRVPSWELQVASCEIVRSGDRRWIQDNGRTVGSGTPSPIMRSGVWRWRGVTFDIRSGEVPRAEARKGHVAGEQGGAHVIDRRTCVAW
jgi:hypothetical protein